jgi:helicase
MSEIIVISEESYFTKQGGFAVIYREGKKSQRFVKDCPKVSDLDFALPYDFLNPLQTAFLYFWDPIKDKSALCVAPTSAGKTGIIYIFFSKFKGRKIYLAPTKSLCDEKFREFQKIFGRENVSLRTGDRFDFKPPQTEYVVATYESFLSAIRSRSSWFEDAEAVCIDEVHFLMFGGTRGITLEEIIAHLRARGKNILALSATVPREAAEEYSDWLSAKLFFSSWRPVPLERIVEPLSEIEKRIFGSKIKDELPRRIFKVAVALAKSPKVIIFVYKKSLGWKILEEFYKEGYGIANETVPFEKTVNVPPEEAVAGFHNADIPYEERVKIEEAFRDGNLKFLISTQTMAYGVNLPADEAFIIVRNWMSKVLPDTSTIIQMEGRVGRFGISQKGISRIIPLSGENLLKRELKNFFESPDTRTSLQKLIQGEDRERKITDLDAITLITLGIIVSSDVELKDKRRAEEEIKKVLSFMKTTFNYDVGKVISILEDAGCIKDGKITPLGRILASTLIPPSAYREFRRRYYGVSPSDRLNAIAYIIRPILFFRDFQKGFIDLLPERLRTDIEAKISDVYEEESILELWMMGEIWWYFRNPPAQFYLRPDALQFVKFISQLKFYGYIDISLKEIMKIALSLSFGVHPDFSLLCGKGNIGFGRGNSIYYATKQKNLSLGEVIELMKKKDKGFAKALYDVMLARAEFLDPSLRSEWAKYDKSKEIERIKIIERINQEINTILSSFDDVQSEDDLFDEEMARVMVFVKLGVEPALQMSKDDLKVFLQQDGKVM